MKDELKVRAKYPEKTQYEIHVVQRTFYRTVKRRAGEKEGVRKIEMENTVKYEVWVMRERPRGGRVMRQFFCKDKAEAIAKVTEWMDKAVKIEVIPA